MSSEEDSYETRQRNEIQALQAIFTSDFEAVKLSSNCDEWIPPEFILLLKPQKGLSENEVYATVNLRVQFSLDYPQCQPTIKLENGQGISSKDIETLQLELEELCQDGVGEEVTFNLAHHAQGFLAERNVKPRFQSFHEEMLATQRNEIEKSVLEEKTRQVKEDEEQLLAFCEEIQKKQPALLSELRRITKLDSNQHPFLDMNFKTAGAQTTVNKNEMQLNIQDATAAPKSCTHSKLKRVCFTNKDGGRIYDFGSCMGTCRPTRYVSAAVETNLKESVAITTYKISCANPESRRKQLSLLEQEFRLLQRIHHPNLIPLFAFKWEMFEDEECFQLYVAEQLMLGLSLNFYINKSLSTSVDLLRHITANVLQALQALHKANVVHKNLRPSCIFMESNGEIRLGDYSLESRVNEIFSLQEDRSTLSMYPSAPGRGGKRADIHRLGIILASLYLGNVVHRLDRLKLPSSMPLLLKDFIGKCIGSHSEKDRFNIDDLLSHAYLKTPIYPEIQDESREDDEFRSVVPLIAPVMDRQNHAPFPSRLLSEFETMQFLGSGGFGDVLKVRNKLDGNIYAIKRILLDAKSRHNKKMVREVKLLSRLNHENIVRYFNSWLETVQPDSPSPSENMENREELKSKVPEIKQKCATEYDSSDSSSGRGGWFTKPQETSSSGGIEFDDSDSINSSSEEESSKEEDTVDAPSFSSPNLQCMYIQMEYCEKSTLRTAIDSELFLDKTRIWRLFREIVEGIAYIHQQGIIHRDLKPVNIFLDSEDHVKIGDFGLATSSPLSNLGANVTIDVLDGAVLPLPSEKSSDVVSSSGQLTGQIGTALYVAPELKCSCKATYNEKVDIYSLGIIFFEMCHPPLVTGMERIKVLSSLRLPEVVLPNSEHLTGKEVQLINWLLNHSPNARPSSTELIQSPILPPPQLEAAELQEMIRHTLSNTQSKAYKHLVASCFQQKMTITEDIVYDMDMTSSMGLHQSAWIHQLLQDVFAKHCERRGAIYFKTPTLAPKAINKTQQQGITQVLLMNHAGSIVTLSADLQTPFARFISRSNVTWLKRYSIDCVYSERKLVGLHPKSSPEMVFDIVTPAPSSVLADAEVLATVSDVFCDHRLRINRPIMLQLGHHLLLKAILIHCGIPEDKRLELCHILKSRSKQEGHILNRTAKLAIPRQSIDMLLNLLELEGTVAKVTAALTNLSSRKGEAASLAKQALHELDVISTHAEFMGLNNPFTIRMDTALQNYATHSGMVFRFVCQSNLKKNKIDDVLANGGRYDALVKSFQNPLVNGRKKDGEPISYPTVVGAMIHLDRVAAILKETEVNDERRMLVHAAIYSVGHRPQTKEQALLVKDLWKSGVRTTVLDHCQSLNEVQLWCRDKNCPHIVILKDTEIGSARLKTWDKDRYTERKMTLSELIDTLKINAESASENADSLTSHTRPDSTNRSNSLSESCGSQTYVSSLGISSNPIVNFHIIIEEKLQIHARKRYEKQILIHIKTTLQNFHSRVQVDVVAIEATDTIIQSLLIALYVDPSDSKSVEQAIGVVVDKHRRQRKYLQRIYEQLLQLKYEKHVTVLIIYGLHDNSHKLIM